MAQGQKGMPELSCRKGEGSYKIWIVKQLLSELAKRSHSCIELRIAFEQRKLRRIVDPEAGEPQGDSSDGGI